MTYRVEYNGEELEVENLDSALDNAKHAIAADLGQISGWAVEHDETINDWFVQGVLDGRAVGPTAVVTGPEPTMAADTFPRHAPAAAEREALRMTFTGATPSEALQMAATWLAGRPEILDVDDVGWHPTRTGYEARVYYRS
ncbi:hypothetical protein [Actinoplanes sp. N902-109]|uniref:hypothetical protein n=1 Tax=Actinoplanes sp. (strain N902-109) TaxID=649831 RepID=UPI00032944F4|nr:hypothetical protein [Actinoplanes sp. N902-109]AGL19650.1 hypothetical protein L083_6140 [Actinoplanes sp. N902-109]